MVTWTFDLVALIIGFMVGLLLGGIIAISICYHEEHDMAEWGKGYKAGSESVKEIYFKVKGENDGTGGTE